MDLYLYFNLDSSHDTDLDTDPNRYITLGLDYNMTWQRGAPNLDLNMDLTLSIYLDPHETQTPLKPEIGVDFELTLNHSLTRRKEAPEAATASQNLKVI